MKISKSKANTDGGKTHRSDFKSSTSGKSKKSYQVSKDVSITAKQHDKLLHHCQDLISSASYQRRKKISAMASTEYDLLGVATPQGSDCDRQQSRAEGRGAAQPDRLFPFGYLKLQKYAAEIVSVVMPYEAPYAVVTAIDKQDMADALTKILRYHSAMFNHRSEITAIIFDALSLDIGAGKLSWDEYGFGTGSMSGTATTDKIQGTRLDHLDPYNITWDASVLPHEVSEHGEFFAEFDLTSKFQVKRMRDQMQLYISDTELSDIVSSNHNYYDKFEDANYSDVEVAGGYYFNPKLNDGRQVADRENKGRQDDFSNLFGSGNSASFNSEYIDGSYAPKGVKITKMYVRLYPAEYGLSEDKLAKMMEIYEITILNDEIVVLARPQKGPQDRMNIVLGNMSYDREPGRQMNHGDAIADLSAFMSSILNTYKRSKRQSLTGGVTIYNSEFIPLHELDDMHGGRLPTRNMHWDTDIRKHVLQLNDPPDTKNDINDAQQVLSLLDLLLPSNTQPELAGLDRATEFQAQAVAMTGDRDLLMHASLCDGQFVTPLRWMMQYFLYANETDMTYIDEKTRQVMSSTPTEIKSSGFQITQPAILMGIDRLRITNLLNTVLNMLLQVGDQMSPLSAVMLKHLIDISGINIDMSDYDEAVQQMMQQQQQQQEAEVAKQQAETQAIQQPEA